MLDETLLRFISEHKLFKGVSSESLITLVQQMTVMVISSGDYLMHEGDPASSMYIVYQGRLRVYRSKDKSQPVAEIGVGGMVGELAILTDMPRVADVRAVRDSMLIEINKDIVHAWVALHPVSAMQMISDSIKRLFPPLLSKGIHGMTTLVLLPCDNALDLTAVSTALLKAIIPYKKCVLLSDADPQVKAALDKGETVSSAYLNACETRHEMVIYVGNANPDPWTRQCIRQADKILMISPDVLEVPSPVIHYLSMEKKTIAEKFLLVCHDVTKKMPHHTDKLIDMMHAERVFHAKEESDYQRIGRFFTGHSVSLVLSGGGLRGAAHIGLYYALQSKGIPVDMVGGSSFGALAAAVVGMKLSRDVANETSAWVQKTLPGLMDYTLPIVALLRGERLYELLTSVFSTKLSIEDLWIPTFCTATDMIDADMKIFERGVVWEAVRASISLPGIFPPVVHEGKILVDGATFNKLPLDIMHERNNGGKIIASSVSTDIPRDRYFASSEGLSGFDVFADRFREKPHTHLPSLFELLLNAEFVGAQKHMHQIKHLSDFYLDLNVTEYGMLDLNHWNEIVDTGFERACRLIEDTGLSKETLGIV